MYEKGCFTKSQYLKIFRSGSKPSILYEQAKVDKPMKDDCPFFRLILSARGTPTNDLFLKLLIENEYTVHNSFSFVKEVSSKNLMTSLGVESLFTIPLEGTIDNIINDLFLTTESS